jgi:hypothetical protein
MYSVYGMSPGNRIIITVISHHIEPEFSKHNKEIEIYELPSKRELMKVRLNHFLLLLSAVLLLILPVAAVMAGNGTSVNPSGNIQTSVTAFVPTTSPTMSLPSIDIPQNVGFVPIWLVLGVILIIIALTGLLWRYFHPKYVAPDEDD